MGSSRAAHHRPEVPKDSESSEESTVHPSSPLLDQNGQVFRGVGEGFGVWDVSQVVTSFLFDINL